MELNQFFAAHTHDRQHPTILADYLQPHRLALRANPDEINRYGDETAFWIAFERVWKEVVDRLSEGDESTLESVQALAGLSVAFSAAKGEYQVMTLKYLEPVLVKFLLIASSLTNLENSLWVNATKPCVRAFANMITGNSAVAKSYLPVRLEAEEQDRLISRLLASQDVQILQPVLVAVLFLIVDSNERTMAFVTSKAGAAILDRACTFIGDIFELDQDALENDEAQEDPLLEITFAIVRAILKVDCFPAAYCAQDSNEEGYLINSTQLTLLKFLDAYLPTSTFLTSPSSSRTTLVCFLMSLFCTLTRALGDEGRTKDARDAAVFMGVVLALEGIASVALGCAEGREGGMKLLEEVVALLGSSNTMISKPAIQSVEEESHQIEPAAIGQLKRTCVRIIGILAFDSKATQERIREAGGIGLLLGMCQISDINPTLREHALFAIRNILHRNQTNQDLVAGMTPQYLVGDDGALRDLPPALR